jgi:hypothetical protein
VQTWLLIADAFKVLQEGEVILGEAVRRETFQ